MATVRELVTEAYQFTGILGFGEDLSAAHGAFGLNRLNRLMELWAMRPMFVQRVTQEAVTVSTPTFTVGDGGDVDVTRSPAAISKASVRLSGIDYPIRIITLDEWVDVADKLTEGEIPRRIYFDPREDLSVCYMNPPPSGSVDLTLYLELPFYFADLNATVTFPLGYYEAVALSLAEMLCLGEQKVPDEVRRQARIARDMISTRNIRVNQLNVGYVGSYDNVLGEFV